ncbi:MAG: NADH-quinone oxidoreductase subunit H [Cyanobacteria bacterium SZAS-4]|nr:NADH-quinone oxidoreductase subunit H [Cyanobacteria bacterium SZAS-4]
MSSIATWSSYLLTVIIFPPLCLGVVRKTKARLQNRVGPAVWQPFFDLHRLTKKRETLSDTMCGVFRLSTVVGLSTTFALAWFIPWVPIKPWSPHADIFTVIYLFALERFFTLLGAMDSGSAFGAFGASRDVTLNLLVEPALCLALVSLSIIANSTDLGAIFSFSHFSTVSLVWFCAGTSIFLTSLAELGRMPVDDPTTHLELTMIHEAMTLEASARNLFLLEFTRMLKLTLFLALSAQCYLRIWAGFATLAPFQQELLVLIGVLLMAIFVGILESLVVKLQWRKVPEFVAYIVTVSLISVFVAMAGNTSL